MKTRYAIGLLSVLLIIVACIYLTRNTRSAKYKAVFSGCARDIEKQLHNSLPDILRLAREFEEYVILIYENDSKDNTIKVIQEYAQQDSRIKLISEKNVTGKRTHRLAHGRNTLLDIAKKYYADYDFYVVMDLDYTRQNTHSILSVADTMPSHYSGVTAVSRKRYYDWWAFRSSALKLDYDCWKDKDNIQQNGDCNSWKHKPINMNGVARKVESAFNGIGVYKLSAIPKDARYVGETSDGGEVCEHVAFHSYLPNLYIDPNLVTSTWDD